MKKIFIIMIALMSIVSCGVANHIENNPYEADGYGFSKVDKNMAYTIAYNKAMSKIAEKFDITTNETFAEDYNSNATDSRFNESEVRNHTLVSNAKVNARDVVVTKVKYTREGRGYSCYVAVKVSPDNLN